METEELNTMLNLTKRDMDVLNILWESDEPKTATMISKSGDGLTMNTTQAVLRKLLKNNLQWYCIDKKLQIRNMPGGIFATETGTPVQVYEQEGFKGCHTCYSSGFRRRP